MIDFEDFDADDAQDVADAIEDATEKSGDAPKYCQQCGEKLSGGKFCPSCGAPASGDGSGGGTAGGGEPKKPRLWNPNAVANWSLLFSPIFGSYLNRQNWLELGEKGRANGALAWFWISIVVVAILAFSPDLPPASGLLYLIIWYVAAGKPQANYVKNKLSGDYEKKGWSKPVFSGLGIIFGILFLFIIMEEYDDYAERAGTETGRLFSSAPECSDKETTDLVIQIARDELAQQLGRAFWDPDGGREFADQVDIEVAGIRTTGQLANQGKECAAQLQITGQQGRETLEIVYTVELTDRGDEIYVMVYGL